MSRRAGRDVWTLAECEAAAWRYGHHRKPRTLPDNPSELERAAFEGLAGALQRSEGRADHHVDFVLLAHGGDDIVNERGHDEFIVRSVLECASRRLQ